MKMNRIMFGSWKRWEKLVRRLGASSCLVFDGQPLSLGCENAKRRQAQCHAGRRVMREYDDDDQGMDCQTSAHGHSMVFELATGKNINANMTIRLTAPYTPTRCNATDGESKRVTCQKRNFLAMESFSGLIRTFNGRPRQCQHPRPVLFEYPSADATNPVGHDAEAVNQFTKSKAASSNGCRSFWRKYFSIHRAQIQLVMEEM